MIPAAVALISHSALELYLFGKEKFNTCYVLSENCTVRDVQNTYQVSGFMAGMFVQVVTATFSRVVLPSLPKKTTEDGDNG